MARLPRLTVPGYPHHIIQRGNDRQAIFRSDEDRLMLLDLLREQSQTQEVAIHAYVLMDNHFHLLATPRTPTGVPTMMQAVGRTYVRRFNDRNRRTGTLWEGRYRSSLVQSERYLLACMVYIDLNPVRAGIAAQPQDYGWSSHGHYAGQRTINWLVPHPLVWELGNTPFAREAAYRTLVQAGVDTRTQQLLTDSTLYGWAAGDDAFASELQGETQRRIGRAARGRPKRSANPV